MFPNSHSSNTFIMHVSLNGISWKVTLSDRVYIWSVLRLSEETILLGPHFLTLPLACYLWDSELNTLIIVYSSLDQSTLSIKAQVPIYNFRPYTYNIYNFFFFFLESIFLGSRLLIFDPNVYRDLSTTTTNYWFWCAQQISSILKLRLI